MYFNYLKYKNGYFKAQTKNQITLSHNSVGT